MVSFEEKLGKKQTSVGVSHIMPESRLFWLYCRQYGLTWNILM